MHLKFLNEFLFCFLFFLGVSESWSLNMDSLPVWKGIEEVEFLDFEKDVLDTVVQDPSKMQAKGYKTMRVVVGDGGTQVDQELRLSLQGDLGHGLYIDALLSDVGREPGMQTTASLQEVDQVYFRLESPYASLHLGDFYWEDKEFSLLGIERSSLGAMLAFHGSNGEVKAAYGVDESKRVSHSFYGNDGQRDGYLVNPEGSFLAIVPGSEKVWINGVELLQEKDYVLNYAGGVLDFKGLLIPGREDLVRVEYDAYNSEALFKFNAFGAHYRRPNIWLDIGGFVLESDVDRLKRGVWSPSDYEKLKQDLGDSLYNDSLELLNRPSSVEKASARLRLQFQERWFLDGELGYHKEDTNMLAPEIKGPQGRAYRFYLSSDSTLSLDHFPLAFDVFTSYYEKGFFSKEFLGSDNHWDSYLLKEEWDLDSVGVEEALEYDAARLRLRLPMDFWSGLEMGYKQEARDAIWNSFRVNTFVEHANSQSKTRLSLIHIESIQDSKKNRTQSSLETKVLRGSFRPFGFLDYSFWKIDSLSSVSYRDRTRSKTGVDFEVFDFNFTEQLSAEKVRIGASDYPLLDSIFFWDMKQNVSMSKKDWSWNHLLQYKRVLLDSAKTEKFWFSENALDIHPKDRGFLLGATYHIGLSDEQTYVPIYKMVSPGTGDVMLDSLTGDFIENVDKGDFVYEGLGRVDSLGSVHQSVMGLSLKMELNLALLLGIRRGFLKDIILKSAVNFEGRDTILKNVYLPSFKKKKLRGLGSGVLYQEYSLLWNYSSSVWTQYTYAKELEKKDYVYSYFQEKRWHELQINWRRDTKNEVFFAAKKEQVNLNALQDLHWKIWDGDAFWRRRVFQFWSLQPGVYFRYGDGADEIRNFELFLKQVQFKISYEKFDFWNASLDFKATDVSANETYLPYQMNAGYLNGTTYRLESMVDVNWTENFSISMRFVMRFGNKNEGLFQKWSTEAKAYF
jgi:hypothetical protein